MRHNRLDARSATPSDVTGPILRRGPFSQREPPMPEPTDLTPLAVEIVSAYVSENQVLKADLPGLIQSVMKALSDLTVPEPIPEVLLPAVPVKKSVTRDYIICLEDGAKLRTMKRYLRRMFDLSPEQYRAKWGLPFDYPMTAPAYSEMRSSMAKELGLGRKPGQKPQRSKGKKS